MSLALSKKITVAGKVRLLLWKNFTLQKRHYFQTIFSTLVPVLFFIFYAILFKYSGSHESKYYYNETYISQQIDTLDHRYRYRSGANRALVKLAFSPNSTLFSDLADQVTKQLNLSENAIGLHNDAELEYYMTANSNVIAGINFHHSPDTAALPKHLAYSLRLPAELRYNYGHWQTTILYTIYTEQSRHAWEREETYQDEDFLTIQNAIAKAFFHAIPKASSAPANVTMPSIRIQRLPTPMNYFDRNATPFRELLPIFLLLLLCFGFMNTVRLVSIEKEKQLKEAMKIMGLSSWIHYLGWFIRTTIMLSITMTLITVLLTLPCFGEWSAIFTHTNFFCMLIFFIGYSLSLTTFSFMICTFFAQAKSAVTAAMALWFVTSLPFLISDEEFLSVGMKTLLCICPNSALAFGIQIISNWELFDDGLNWRTAFQQQGMKVQGDLTVAMIFCLFVAYAILFFLITVYMENVFPGEYGVAKPWYFIFTKKFWLNLNRYEKFTEQNQGNDQFELAHSTVDQANFEQEPTNEPIGIEIKNLTKKYLSDTAVLDNLTLNIYYNQITSLLGHNGAGKTTAVGMLCGMIEPTSGTASINGYDIRRYMDSARKSMGFCPQHNILFDELTVREHILFYCCLKGLDEVAAEAEAQKYIQLMDLGDKVNEMSSTLSGGMKRKLSVVIALCGHSKVVFLDEPTAGMDPGARRALWDILLAEKKDRAILLTTHFMDEADVLSDRIAILANGELKCTGSTFFLKKRFGTGYHLICAKGNNCSSGRITNLLQKYIPDIQVEYENDSELSYILPESRNDVFTTIFKDLESNENQLDVNGFGVSLTTLEEVFMKLGQSENVDPIKSANGLTNNHHNNQNHFQTMQQDHGSSQNVETQIILNENFSLLSGPALWKNQAIAMLKKRFLCWLRAWPSFLYYNLFTIFMMSFIIINFVQLFSGKPPGLPPLDLTIDLYKSSVAVLQDDPTSNIAKQYESTVNALPTIKLRKVTGDMETALLRISGTALQETAPATAIKQYKYHYAMGMSLKNDDDDSITAWHSVEMKHSSPIALNLVHTAIINSYAASDGYSISITNEPLSIQPDEELNDEGLIMRADATFEFLFPFIVYIIMSILSAKYTSFYIEEKQCNAKFMQYVSGVRMPIFWGISILWDMLTTTIVIFVIMLMLLIFPLRHFRTPIEYLAVFVILCMYNFAMTPIICIWSLMFNKPSFGRTFVSIFNVIVVPALYLVNFLIRVIFTHGVESRSLDMQNFWLWPYPLVTMFDAIFRLEISQYSYLGLEFEELFGISGIGLDLVVMFLIGIISYGILIVIELGSIKILKMFILKHWSRVRSSNNDADDSAATIDDDVLAEKIRIEQMSDMELKTQAMVLKNVTKHYGRQFTAVKNVSFSMRGADCFGLLGKNGAGKTTIFKMLTGETIISSGEIFTYGHNQMYQLPEIYKMTGYCPQFDALLVGLTCRETLEIFAMVRGIAASDVRHYVEEYARNLDFIQHIDKKVKQLSGGNKRKLSTCLAIIGNLKVILLDEPSAGMDPATKRNLWNVIVQARDSGKSILLTSHSMEECEALCTQITVLVNGKCKCLGSSQHLKNKFNKGFQLKIKVKQDDEMQSINQVKDFVSNTFNGAIFRDEYQGLLTYSIITDTIKWSSVFEIMEEAKRILNIEDYSISQNSLEQVVLKLLNEQSDQIDGDFNEISFNDTYLKM